MDREKIIKHLVTIVIDAIIALSIIVERDPETVIDMISKSRQLSKQTSQPN